MAQYLIGSDGANGNSRKLLGLTFQGETRDAGGMIWGDVTIKGLTSEANRVPSHLNSTQVSHSFGTSGENPDILPLWHVL